MSRIKKEIDRDKIMSGEVIRVNEFNLRPNSTNIVDNFLGENVELNVGDATTYRSILFTISYDHTSKDLLYANSDYNYPVLNVSSNIQCLGSRIIISGAYNLGELLKHFGYTKCLSENQMPEIRKRFFSGRFGMDHCELFGLKEVIPEEFIAEKQEKEITDPKQIYEEYKKAVTLKSERVFERCEEDGKFPIELMWLLDERGQYIIRDPFLPTKEEMEAYTKKPMK